jgi:hypothetical protein
MAYDAAVRSLFAEEVVMSRTALRFGAGILVGWLAVACGEPPAASDRESPSLTTSAVTIPPDLRAGLRASNYGITPYPAPAWWQSSIQSMAGRFPGAAGEQVAVVVEVSGGGGRGKCWAHFPNPQPGRVWPNVTFDATDLFAPSFNTFDGVGIKVWLQVEPASCDVAMLIELVMAQYGARPSVIGFGVDVEWYRKDITRDGKAVTDAEARDWVARTTAARAGALVFLKHWLSSKMPPTERNGLVFIDDSQGHGSLTNMVNEFAAWGQAFAPTPVGFQFGYRSDKRWWSNLADPPLEIGNALLERIPNTRDLVWVDFTAYDIWPAP